MKRFDKGYLQMRDLIESGDFGEPLVVRTTQRAENISESYPYYTNEMQITDSVIHDIDLLPWLIGRDEWDEAQSLTSKATKNAPDGLQDPLVVIMKTKKGVLCVVEHFVNTGFVGFEVTTEVVCEDGVINLPAPSSPITRKNSQMAVAIERDWLLRFDHAYDLEIQEWVDKALKGTAGGSSAWDGFTAAVTADALLASQKSGKPEKVISGEAPDLYLN
jgi:myo-inositol 2-dehydrogenase/D-chiro-inositol 1-dehydrogenase